jgi:hypothetical protein
VWEREREKGCYRKTLLVRFPYENWIFPFFSLQQRERERKRECESVRVCSRKREWEKLNKERKGDAEKNPFVDLSTLMQKGSKRTFQGFLKKAFFKLNKNWKVYLNVVFFCQS